MINFHEIIITNIENIWPHIHGLEIYNLFLTSRNLQNKMKELKLFNNNSFYEKQSKYTHFLAFAHSNNHDKDKNLVFVSYQNEKELQTKMFLNLDNITYWYTYLFEMRYNYIRCYNCRKYLEYSYYSIYDGLCNYCEENMKYFGLWKCSSCKKYFDNDDEFDNCAIDNENTEFVCYKCIEKYFNRVKNNIENSQYLREKKTKQKIKSIIKNPQ